MCGALDVIPYPLVRVLIILAHFGKALVIAIVAIPRCGSPACLHSRVQTLLQA